jgi:hypothetical protein
LFIRAIRVDSKRTTRERVILLTPGVQRDSFCEAVLEEARPI